MELSRRTWTAAVKLAAIISAMAAIVAAVTYTTGEVSQVAIVLPVIVIGFVASWVQTGRVQREPTTLRIPINHG